MNPIWWYAKMSENAHTKKKGKGGDNLMVDFQQGI